MCRTTVREGANTLLSAVTLVLFGALAESPLEYEELHPRTGLHPRGARYSFDTLVALGFLDRALGGVELPGG